MNDIAALSEQLERSALQMEQQRRARLDAQKQPLFIDVITAARDPDAPPEQSHRINYNRLQSRDWLNGHIAWALNTGRTVHLARSE